MEMAVFFYLTHIKIAFQLDGLVDQTLPLYEYVGLT
jgi:hypothetical protein